jgi:ATP-dependent DNA helicase RecG
MLKSDLEKLVGDLQASRAESRHVEAKASQTGPPKRLWETLSAFSNSPGGGVILLGVSEERGFEVTGVQ